ncbi:hypothetical protein [Frankia sp. Cas3]|uniref:hypothetical protein n=1 Tax=Frankia sp. Cas3 TaxID=3073926 RepID=UPI002AD57A3E|nr:hypothetical protein [Frankia sp. Cas3]
MANNNATRQTCIWSYQVRPDAEGDFVGLLERHWPTLHGLGLVTDEPPIVLRSAEGPLTYVEIFTWETEGMRPAHDHPDVIEIWEPMKRLVEERVEARNVPGMSFPLFNRVDLGT